MAERCVYTLKINELYRRLVPPLSTAELKQLEKNIIHDGCREPLCVWNNTILDGHNRYEICLRLQIPFTIRRIYFKNNEEAIAWICANQLGRRNITDETRKYLIGKRYEMEKILGAHNAVGINQHKIKEAKPKLSVEPAFERHSSRTSTRLGEEYHISHSTVEKYGVYACALDALSKTVPEFMPKVLSNQIRISHESIIEFSQLSPKEVLRLSTYIFDNSNDHVGYSDIRNILPRRQNPINQLTSTQPTGSIKDMPTYDPDGEISSLTLTIPSWISSINRTRSIANFSEISNYACSNLEKELLELKETINIMLTVIKEEF